MQVTPIAMTAILVGAPESIKGTAFHHQRYQIVSQDQDIDVLHELAGRACYQSWDMPNPKTATNRGYMRNIIEQAHTSVMEHGSVTFYIEGVSRSLTHELVRHRHLSFSELSQRYVDMGETRQVVPPAVRDSVLEEFEEHHDLIPLEEKTIEDYEYIVERLIEKGYKRKQAREAARSVLPNATETKIVVTGNLTAWRHFLHKRWHVAADAEIRELAGEILKHLRDLAPNSVQDIPEEPFQ